MKKFEYKVLDVVTAGFFRWKIDYQELTDRLNELGREGWEAVSTSTNMYSNITRGLIVILKREIN